MALLKCDICGGSLVMDVNGEFATCEFCGMNHTKERLKIKLDEIDGSTTNQKSDSLFN